MIKRRIKIAGQIELDPDAWKHKQKEAPKETPGFDPGTENFHKRQEEATFKKIRENFSEYLHKLVGSDSPSDIASLFSSTQADMQQKKIQVLKKLDEYYKLLPTYDKNVLLKKTDSQTPNFTQWVLRKIIANAKNHKGVKLKVTAKVKTAAVCPNCKKKITNKRTNVCENCKKPTRVPTHKKSPKGTVVKQAMDSRLQIFSNSLSRLDPAIRPLVEAVMVYAIDHYEDGWDAVAEAWEPQEIAEEIEGCTTAKEAIAKMAEMVGLYIDKSLDARWGEDSDPELENSRRFDELRKKEGY